MASSQKVPLVATMSKCSGSIPNFVTVAWHRGPWAKEPVGPVAGYHVEVHVEDGLEGGGPTRLDEVDAVGRQFREGGLG